MHLAALITGGKDSILALCKAQEMGHTVDILVSMIPKRSDSYMFHHPNIHMTDYIAEALEIPLVKAETSGIKEKELEDLKTLLDSLDVDGVVSGAIASTYQKERVDRVSNKLGIKSVAPLWNKDPLKLMKELIALKFRAIIVGVYALGLDQSWLGRELNAETLEKLLALNKKFQVSLVGEGGEYESLVLDAPVFRKRIEIVNAETIYENGSGVYSVKEAKLVEKTDNNVQTAVHEVNEKDF